MPLNYTYTVAHTNVQTGTAINWELTGADLSDFVATSGSETADGSLTTQITLQVNESSGTDGDRPVTLNVSFDGTPTTSPDAQINITLTDGNAVANAPTVTPNTTTPTEGDTVTFTFGEAAGSNAATYYFDITHGTTSNADFTADPPGNGATARTTVTWNGTAFSPATVDVTLAGAGGADGVDDNETFTGKLFDALTSGTEVATTGTITVADDPATASFALPVQIICNSQPGDVSRATANLTSTGDFNVLGDNGISSSSSLDAPINTGGAGSLDDTWAEDTEHVAGFGDDYQVKAVSYNSLGTVLDATLVSGASGGGTKTWVNDTGSQTNAQLWHRLDSGFTIAVGGGTSGDTIRQVEFEIKEYSGTLGTGTTVLTQAVDMEALHPL